MILTLGFGLIGFLDDYLKVVLRRSDGLMPRQKLLGQFIVTVIFLFVLIRVTRVPMDLLIPFAGGRVIHMGWLMAGSVVGYKKAAQRFAIAAVIGVGLGDTGAQDDAARKACKLPAEVPVFTVQGGMDHQKLQGGYKVGIDILTKVMAAKKNRTPGEDRMVTLLQKGGDYVSEKELAAVLRWYNTASN
jgi:hypothetical protein